MCYRGPVDDTPDEVSDAPDDDRDPRPVGAAQGARGPEARSREARSREARGRDPGRPASRAASRAEPAERTSTRQRIGIRELRQHASVYVDLAEKGYTVDITNRGRLVAQLVPAFEPGSPLERLIAAGIVEPAEEAGGIGDIEPYPSSAHAAGPAGGAGQGHGAGPAGGAGQAHAAGQGHAAGHR
jgi:antitoxin (DNA-binding transcriptional repressor) of toxin-antitoxin stability system